jgi:hypothetical protein
LIEPGYALILDAPATPLGSVALSLIRLGIDVLYANDPEEASLLCGQAEADRVRALVVAEDVPIEAIQSLRARLDRRRGRPPVGVVVVGRLTDEARCAALAKEGVRHVLRPPFDPGILRWMVNVAMKPEDERLRTQPRVPTSLLARVSDGERSKDMVVTNLSVGGAFLETPFPHPIGTRLEVEIPLPNGDIRASGLVGYRREPGDVQGPAFPSGLGLVFEPLEGESAERLAAFVERMERHFTL